MSQRAVFAALLLALGLVAGALFLLREGADTNGSRPGRSNPDGSVAAGPGGGAGAPDLLGSEEEDGATPGQRAARRPGRPGADGAGESAAVTPSEAPASESAGGDAEEKPGAGAPLGTGGAAIVVVITEDGKAPLVPVLVEAESAGGSRRVSSDRKGRAEISAIPAGTYDLHVPPTRSFPFTLRTSRGVAVAEGETLEVRCEIPALDAEIAGRVLDAEGRTVAGIEIDARPLAFPAAGATFVLAGSPLPPGASGPDGGYRISGLARVEHLLSTRETDSHPRVAVTALAGSGEPVDIVIGARRTLIVGGTVSDSDGAPLAGARVSVSSSPGDVVWSGVAGTYRIEVQYERGAAAVSALKEGYAPGEAIVPAADIEGRDGVEVDIRLEPLGEPAELTGRVATSEGEPLPRQTVHLYSSLRNASYQGVSGEDGEFAVRDVRPAADFRVWVHPEHGYRDFVQSPVEVAAGANRMDITLAPLETGTFRGRLVDPDGRPVPRVTLWMRSLSASAVSIAAASGPDGRFGAEDVPLGEVYLETRASPWVSVRGLQVEAGPARETDLPIGLGKGTLNGMVSASGAPVPAARITLTWSTASGPLQSTVFREATSDARGRFTFSGLARGRSSLAAQAAGYLERRLSRDLGGGSEEMEIEITPAAAR